MSLFPEETTRDAESRLGVYLPPHGRIAGCRPLPEHGDGSWLVKTQDSPAAYSLYVVCASDGSCSPVPLAPRPCTPTEERVDTRARSFVTECARETKAARETKEALRLSEDDFEWVPESGPEHHADDGQKQVTYAGSTPGEPEEYQNPPEWGTWRDITGAWDGVQVAAAKAVSLGQRLLGAFSRSAPQPPEEDPENSVMFPTDLTELGTPPKDEAQACWIGHSTVLLQLAGVTVLVDPVWSYNLAGGTQRTNKPPFGIKMMPRVDIVLVTHNHSDHLDYPTVIALRDLHDPLFLVPHGLGKWFLDSDITQVKEMCWWEETNFKRVQIAFVPAQHWSRRAVFDTNKSWWGGWVVKSAHPAISIYHAGDTGYCPVFPDIAKHYGPFDLSFLPIGPIEPANLMEPQYCTPAQAVRIHLEVQSRKSIGIHWETFGIGTDRPGDPVRALAKVLHEHGNSLDFLVVPIGFLIPVRVAPAALPDKTNTCDAQRWAALPEQQRHAVVEAGGIEVLVDGLRAHEASPRVALRALRGRRGGVRADHQGVDSRAAGGAGTAGRCAPWIHIGGAPTWRAPGAGRSRVLLLAGGVRCADADAARAVQVSVDAVKAGLLARDLGALDSGC
eukprot:m51a1_g451 hypothetical protein (616) ;mRNA; r:136547-140845